MQFLTYYEQHISQGKQGYQKALLLDNAQKAHASEQQSLPILTTILFMLNVAS